MGTKHEKIVELKNVTLVVHGCTEPLDLEEKIPYGYAIVRTYDVETLRLNDEYVEPEQLPDTIKDSKLEIMSDEAEMIIALQDRLCKAYTDGEYAHLVCITEEDVQKLTSYLLGITWSKIQEARGEN